MSFLKKYAFFNRCFFLIKLIRRRMEKNYETPKEKPDVRKPYIKETLYDFVMNSKTYFSISTRYYPKITPQNPIIYILGKEFSLKDKEDPKIINHKIEEYLNKILWFSYRKNFPILKPTTLSKSFISDTGWGCSIRVCQMLFAETIKRHLGRLNAVPEDLFIVSLFNDMEQDYYQSPFSIQQISLVSAEMFNILPGSWYSFPHTFLIFEKLYKEYAQKIFSPMEFLVFPDGILFFNQIYEKNSFYPNCELCRINPKPTKFREKLCEKCRKFNKPLLLLICLMPRTDTLKTDDFPFIKSLMSTRFFVGLMGGKPGRAKYFVSFDQDDKLIAKDPHFVQDSYPNGSESVESFYTKDIKVVDIRKMSSSLAFGFYFIDEAEWEEFEEFIRKEKEVLDDKWLLAFEEEYREIDEKKDFIDLYEEEKKEIEVAEEDNIVILGFKGDIELKKNFF